MDPACAALNTILANAVLMNTAITFDMTTYTPGQALSCQYKAQDSLIPSMTVYYKLDANGYPVSTLVPKVGNAAAYWYTGFLNSSQYTTGNIVSMPAGMTPALSSSDTLTLAQGLASSGMFKASTSYIIIGDEPVGGSGVVDLSTMMTPAQFQQFLQFFTLMPREFLRTWYEQNILTLLPTSMAAIGGAMPSGFTPTPQIPVYGGAQNNVPYDSMVWGAVIDVFNQANSAYILSNPMDPWDWEAKKTLAFYQSQSSNTASTLSAQLNSADNIALELDPQAVSIMTDFLTLPVLGDPGLEINRQNAIRGLLLQKEYASAQAIVDAFRSAGNTVLNQVLTTPIPFDIMTGDGTTIVATPASAQAVAVQ